MKLEENMESTVKKASVGKKVVRTVLIVLASLLVCALVFVGILFIWSPAEIDPFLDNNGEVLENSISEKIFVEIGGVQQGMIIKGKDINNPVLLFLHGGPGMPTYFLAEKYPTGLEDNFTVCYWEQRGAGISYSSEIMAETMTAEQLISDAIEVTYYLQERFGQDKIYLMGHSWGSYIGIQVAAEAPELYCAYIGVSQITYQPESEELAYDYMIEQYKAAGNTKMAEELESYNISESDEALIKYFKSPIRDKTMHELGVGTMHDMNSVITGVFLPVMQCRAYTVEEKINVWKAKQFLLNQTVLIDELLTTDIPQKIPALEVSVYIIGGIYDYTVNYGLAKAYLGQLQAPVKGFYTFENSAHCPMHEEADKFNQIMVEDVLNGTVDLADKQQANGAIQFDPEE